MTESAESIAATEEEAPRVAESPRCANCDARLAGAYCHACGQKSVEVRPAFRDFYAEAAGEFVNVDSRIFRTMKLLLLAPGELTHEFNRGRRVTYVSPLRLYLIWSVIFFACFAFAANRGRGLRVSYDPSGVRAPSMSAFEKRIADGVLKAQRDPKVFGAALVGSLPKAMFLLMPFFALLLLLFFRRQENLYVPHLYASIHLHAFVFFMFSIAIGLSLARSALDRHPGPQLAISVVLAILLLTPIPYFFVALRRLYGQTWTRTIIKGLALGAVYNAFLLVTMMAVVVYTVLQL